MQNKKKEYEKMYSDTIEKVSAEASREAETIINSSRDKAKSMRLDLPKNEISKIVIHMITKYLEE
jgi:vacuolar-type H+-ATPase subunit H